MKGPLGLALNYESLEPRVLMCFFFFLGGGGGGCIPFSYGRLSKLWSLLWILYIFGAVI